MASGARGRSSHRVGLRAAPPSARASCTVTISSSGGVSASVGMCHATVLRVCCGVCCGGCVVVAPIRSVCARCHRESGGTQCLLDARVGSAGALMYLWTRDESVDTEVPEVQVVM